MKRFDIKTTRKVRNWFILIYRNQNKRLGYTSKLTSGSSADIILSHPWFKGISLSRILSKSLIPQRPYLKQTLQEWVEWMSPKEQAVIKSINSNLQEQIKSKILQNNFL